MIISRRCTTASQAALDYSPAHTVWVRNVSGLPWVVRPIFLRSNKVVRFAAGTLVVAKRGEFHATNASLFNVGYSYHFVPNATHKVRKTPSWPKSWANFSLF